MDVAAITRLVQGHVLDGALSRDVGHEVVYRLPLSGAAHFGSLLEAVDARKGELGITDYSVSMTTLEEVFLRLEHDSQLGSAAEPAHKTYSPFHVDMSEEYSGVTSPGQQFRTLTRFRFLQYIRTKVVVAFVILMPVLFIIIGLTIYTVIPLPSTTEVILEVGRFS